VKDVTDLSSTPEAKERNSKTKPRKFENKLKSTKIKKWLNQKGVNMGQN